MKILVILILNFFTSLSIHSQNKIELQFEEFKEFYKPLYFVTPDSVYELKVSINEYGNYSFHSKDVELSKSMDYYFFEGNSHTSKNFRPKRYIAEKVDSIYPYCPNSIKYPKHTLENIRGLDVYNNQLSDDIYISFIYSKLNIPIISKEKQTTLRILIPFYRNETEQNQLVRETDFCFLEINFFADRALLHKTIASSIDTNGFKIVFRDSVNLKEKDILRLKKELNSAMDSTDVICKGAGDLSLLEYWVAPKYRRFLIKNDCKYDNRAIRKSINAYYTLQEFSFKYFRKKRVSESQ